MSSQRHCDTYVESRPGFTKLGPIWDNRQVPKTGTVWRMKSDTSVTVTIERGFSRMDVYYIHPDGKSACDGKVKFYERWEPCGATPRGPGCPT